MFYLSGSLILDHIRTGFVTSRIIVELIVFSMLLIQMSLTNMYIFDAFFIRYSLDFVARDSRRYG